jgi:Cu(I)/Ag(I) efflux system membrane fusion protein
MGGKTKTISPEEINNMKKTLLIVAVAVLMNTPALIRAADSPALMQPVKSVYEHYLKIQTDLASDSLKGVSEDADAITKAVQGDSMKMLPEAVAKQAEVLAKASDLKTARAAFKPLSNSLIKYLADHHTKNAYVEVYCPMADASWLQATKNVNNPYLGKEMPTCGEIKN